ncbi:MAG: signal peptidase I [Patescibacteria group bacterium]|nr:signal peptidase I [Patescibacteria group bacterium]
MPNKKNTKKNSTKKEQPKENLAEKEAQENKVKIKPGFRRLTKLQKKEEFLPSFTKSFVSFIFEVLKVVVISLAIIIPVRYFLIQPFYVRGASMEPNFHDNEYLIINELTYRFSQPERGDVVVVNEKEKAGGYIIKRIIGLPGEKIVIQEGKVEVYSHSDSKGKILEENYLDKNTKTSGNITIRLKNNEYYVLGDNRSSSLDSRSIGPIIKDQIVGYAWLRAWPFYKMKYFISPEYNL